MRYYLLIAVVLVALGRLSGQKFDQSESLYGVTYKQILRDAQDAFELDKDYYTAMRRYATAIEIKPKDMELRFRYAESARMAGAFIFAETGYADVIKLRETDKYPLAEFWLANVKTMLGKYTEAIELYDKFMAAHLGNEDVESYFIDRAKKEKEDCLWARDIAEEQHNVVVQHLPAGINTPSKEFGAFSLNDTLYYASLNFESTSEKGTKERRYARMLFSANGETGMQLMNGVNDTTKHTANLVVNQDRTKRFFTRCEYKDEFSSEIICAIYGQTLTEDGTWSTPELLPDQINEAGTSNTHPSVGIDKASGEEYLYFASDRANGNGKLDIWMSKILKEGGFTMPENLSTINTAENDVTPFFHNSTQTLYYSSEGKKGLGGLDIYKIRKTKNGWATSENVGKPVNSSLNDLHFSLNEEGNMGYFSSNRVGSTYLEPEYQLCCEDLYAAEFNIMAELLALVYTKENETALPETTMRLLEKLPNGEILEAAKLTNPESNLFPFFVERGKTYFLEAAHNGFVTQIDTFSVPFDAPDKIERKIYLSPIYVDLFALTYDLDSEEAISGASVQIIEVNGDEEKIVQEQFNEYGNDFKFPLSLNKEYLIRANKPGYKPLEELKLSTVGITKPEQFAADLYLKRISFSDFLPLAIYFDNDYPDQNTVQKTTTANYEETVEEYYQRKEEYKLLFTEPMEKEEAFLTTERYEAFFEREVKNGMEGLRKFAEVLYEFLERGNEVEIKLRGFASPRAEDQYNYNLSYRRITSVENFLRAYKGGALIPYMNKGALTIDRDPIGEKTAPNYVTDMIEDERNSIYSLGASIERRVEIVEVEIRLNDFDVESGVFTRKGVDKKD